MECGWSIPRRGRQNRSLVLRSRDEFGRLIRSLSHDHLENSALRLHISLPMADNNDRDSNQGDNEHNNDLNVNQPRTLRDYLQPARSSIPSCIIIPPGSGNVDLKPGVINLLPKFYGLDSESPYLHLKEFDEVCGTLHFVNVADDIVKLKLFPFSLKEKAKSWLYSLRPRTIGTWQELTREFFKQFFPVHRTNKLRKQISTFSQKDNETFYQAWKMFKDLVLACLHHGYEHGDSSDSSMMD